MKDNEKMWYTEWWTKINTDVLVLILANILRILKVSAANGLISVFVVWIEIDIRKVFLWRFF